MKKLIILLSLMLIGLSANAANKDSNIHCQSYGARNSTTMQSVITAIGPNRARLIVEGIWEMTNNLTFGSNLDLLFFPGGRFNTTNSVTNTINGSFNSYDTTAEIFSGNGIVTGSGTCLYWYDAWGNTNTCPIYTNAIFRPSEWLDENNLEAAIINIYPDLQTQAVSGYIEGCWGSYVDSNTVSIGIGDGYCNDSYFKITAATNVDVTLIGGVTNFHYIYIDDSASTYPAGLVYYSSTSAPSEVVSLNGYYCSTSTADRVLWSAMEYEPHNGIISNFQENGTCSFYAHLPCADNMNPDGTWQDPDDNPSSTFLPVNVDEGLFSIQAGDAGAQCSGGFTTAEHSAICAINYGVGYVLGYNGAMVNNFRVKMGATREIKVAGENDDDNALDTSCDGYTIKR